MDKENIFVVITETNGKLRTDAVIALNKDDAKDTIEEQFDLSTILFLGSPNEVAKIESSIIDSKSEHFGIKTNTWGLTDIIELTEKEAEQKIEDNDLTTLVYGKDLVLEFFKIANEDFVENLNNSPIVSEKIAGELI